MRFSVVLVPDPEDGGYVVTVPALLGCVSEGDTVEEALVNVRDAISLFLESAVAHNEPLPDDVQPLVTSVKVAG